MMTVIAQPHAETVQENYPAPHITSNYNGLTRIPSPIKFDTAIDGTHLRAINGDIYELPSLLIPVAENTIEEKAQKKLSDLTLNQKCTAYVTRSSEVGRVNRMGHKWAELECGDNKTWVSGQLISEGLVIVWPNTNTPELTNDLLEIENHARHTKRGLWENSTISIKTPETIENHINSRQIVEGTIYNTALVKNNIFLNFGENWKTDFTIGISSPLRREFSRKNINLQSLNGKKIRVRGWVRHYNGAFIELENTQQLELLTPTESKNQSDEKTAIMQSIHTPIAPKVSQPKEPEAPSEKRKAND